MGTERITKKWNEHLCAPRLDNLDERHNLPQLTQEEIDNVHRLKAIEEVKSMSIDF